MGLSRLQLFSPCVLFFGSHVSLISKYTVGLHLGMRDMLHLCVVCVGLAHGLVATSAFFSMRPFLWLADITVYSWSALGYA